MKSLLVNWIVMAVLFLYYLPMIIHTVKQGKVYFSANNSLFNAFSICAECCGIIFIIRKGTGDNLFGFQSLVQIWAFILINLAVLAWEYYVFFTGRIRDENQIVFHIELFPAVGMLINGAICLSPITVICSVIYFVTHYIAVRDTLKRIEEEKKENESDNSINSPYDFS